MEVTDMNNNEILKTVENWVRSVQGRNLQGAVDNHTEDIIIFDVPMPYQSKGLEAYAETWELFFANNKGGKESFDIAELQVVAGDDVGFCFGLINVFNSKVRITIGLKKVNSQWLIAHEHHSYPINL
jgi:ketosteroid isomerase-like protein